MLFNDDKRFQCSDKMNWRKFKVMQVKSKFKCSPRNSNLRPKLELNNYNFMHFALLSIVVLEWEIRNKSIVLYIKYIAKYLAISIMYLTRNIIDKGICSILTIYHTNIILHFWSILTSNLESSSVSCRFIIYLMQCALDWKIICND